MATKFIASLDTDVEARCSVAAIQELVERFGARSFQTTYSRTTGRPEAIRFTIVDATVPGSPELTVQLTAPTKVLERELRERAARTPKDGAIEARAERIAWRHLHDFVRASLIGVQDGLLTVGSAFLSSLVVERADGGEETFGEALARGGLLIPSASGRLQLGRGS